MDLLKLLFNRAAETDNIAFLGIGS